MIWNILFRSGAVSICFALVLGVGVVISCSPENVSCAVPAGQSVASAAIGDLAIAFGVAFVTTIGFDLVLRRHAPGSALPNILYPIVLVAPLAVPYCIGTGCNDRSVLWFPISLTVAAIIAAILRTIIRARQLKQL